MNEIDELVELCKMIGSDIYQVQAAGGNVSIKVDTSYLYIKASGIRMYEVNEDFGWTKVQYADLRDKFLYLSKAEMERTQKEKIYAGIIAVGSIETGKRPSMETGFHSVISFKYVVHVHSISGILIGMMPKASATQFLKDCFGNDIQIYFIPVTIPGFEVTDKVRTLSSQVSQKPVLYLLENHGLIWGAPDIKILKKIIDKFQKFFEIKFRLKNFSYFHHLGSEKCSNRFEPLSVGDTSSTYCICHWPNKSIHFGPSFPDFIMYFNFWDHTEEDIKMIGNCAMRLQGLSPRNLKDKEEILFAHLLICSIAEQYDCLHFMPEEMVGIIKNLETERLRFLQMKNSSNF